MNPLIAKDSPRDRLRFLIVMAAGLLLFLAGLWVYRTYFEVADPSKHLQMPYKTTAEVIEHFGLLDGDGHRMLTISRGDRRSAAMTWPAGEWPLACRFFADAATPDRLAIIQVSAVTMEQDPGRWLDANTLENIALSDLPADLHLLDNAFIE